MLDVSPAARVATVALICGLVVVDVGISARRPHAVESREAAAWSVFYVAVAFVSGSIT